MDVAPPGKMSVHVPDEQHSKTRATTWVCMVHGGIILDEFGFFFSQLFGGHNQTLFLEMSSLSTND